MRYSAGRAVLRLALVIVLCAAPAHSRGIEIRHVVVLCDERIDMPGLSKPDFGLAQALTSGAPDGAAICREPMDLSRFGSPACSGLLQRHLEEKCRERRIDVVVAAIGPTLDSQGVPAAELPDDAEVRFYDPTLWDLYGNYLIAGGIVLVVQAVTIVGLFVQRLRRRRVEAELRESEAIKRAVLNAALDPIITLDREGLIVDFNPAAERLFDRHRRAAIGQPLLDTIAPGSVRREVQRRLLRVLADDGAAEMRIETQARRADGGVFPVELSLARAERAGSAPIFTCYVHDLTERMRAEAEARRHRDELAHVRRVVTIGELTGSMAHELKQPLAAILSNAEAAELLLASGRPSLDQLREMLEDIRRDDLRAAEIIESIRGFLKRGDATRELLDLNRTVADVIRLASTDAAARKVAIVFDPAESLPSVWAERVQIEQVLMNLILNAFDAMEEMPRPGPRLTIRTARSSCGTVTVSASDTGPGIPADHLTRIFDPFFTTKDDGLGMGLSISRSIVQAHHGRLWAENGPSGGATVIFQLPVFSDAPARGGRCSES